MVRIRSVKPLERFWVRLEFTDGTERTIDLEPYLRGPIFGSVKKDPKMFRAVRVDPLLGTIVWDNGADIDPDVLYQDVPPSWAEEEQAVEAREPPAR